MTRAYGRARRGERVVDYAPQGHWITTTVVAGITHQSPIALMVLEGPMDAEFFESYLKQVQIPTLPKDAIVVMDKLDAITNQSAETS